MNGITVGELKEMLENMDDNMIVRTWHVGFPSLPMCKIVSVGSNRAFVTLACDFEPEYSGK